MECPHCLDAIHPSFTYNHLSFFHETKGKATAIINWHGCPSCGKYIVFIGFPEDDAKVENFTNSTFLTSDLSKSSTVTMIFPKTKARRGLSPDIPPDFAKEFGEASQVLPISPNASAAVSRRCLQRLLREKGGVKPGDLSKEIQQVLDSKQLPTHLADAIDAVRAIGNFGAHPIKSTQTGVIVDVEAGEAEWDMDVLEGLFDFYFVQPAQTQRKRTALNQRLSAAKKPPIK